MSTNASLSELKEGGESENREKLDFEPVKVNFVFARTQNLRFEVIDESKKDDDKLIGKLETTMGSILGSDKSVLIGNLQAED